MAPRKSITPADAASDDRLTRNDYRVLMVIGRHADRSGRCIVRHRLIAGELRLTRRSVIRICARLVALGYLEALARFGDQGGQLANGYQLKTPDREPELELEGGVTRESRGGVTHRVTGGVTPGVTPLTTPSERQEKTNTPRVGIFDHAGKRNGRPGDRPTVHDGQRELLPPNLVDAVAGAPGSPPSAVSPMGEQWEPSDVDRAWARGQGLSEAEISEEAERCRDHWLSKPGVQLPGNASAAWRTWIRGYRDRGGAAGRNGGSHGQHHRRAAGQSQADSLAAAFRDLRTGGTDEPG